MLMSSPNTYSNYVKKLDQAGIDALNSHKFLLSSQSSDSDEDFIPINNPEPLVDINSIFSHPIFSTTIPKTSTMIQDTIKYLIQLRSFIISCVEKCEWPFSQTHQQFVISFKMVFGFSNSAPTYEQCLRFINHLCELKFNQSERHSLWFKLAQFLIKFHGLSQAGTLVLSRMISLPSHSTYLRFRQLLVDKLELYMDSLHRSSLLVLHFDNHQLKNIKHNLKLATKQSEFYIMLAGACASVPDELIPAPLQQIQNLPTFRSINALDTFNDDIFNDSDDLDLYDLSNTWISTIQSKFQTLQSFSNFEATINTDPDIPSAFLNKLPTHEIYDTTKLDPKLNFYTRPMVFGSPNKATCEQMIQNAAKWKYTEDSGHIGMSLDLRPSKHKILEKWKSFSYTLYEILIKHMVSKPRSPSKVILKSNFSQTEFLSKSLQNVNFLLKYASKRVYPSTNKCSFGGIICGVDQKIYQWIISNIHDTQNFEQFPILGEMHLLYNISRNLIQKVRTLPMGKFIFEQLETQLTDNGTLGPLTGPFMERTTDFFIILGYAIGTIDNILRSSNSHSSLYRKGKNLLSSRQWDFFYFVYEVATTLNILRISFVNCDCERYLDCIRRITIFVHAFPGTTLSEYRSSCVDFYVSLRRLPLSWRAKILELSAVNPMYNQLGLKSPFRQYLDWGNEFLNLSMNFVSSGAVSEQSITKQASFSTICSILRPHLYSAMDIEKTFRVENPGSTKNLLVIASTIVNFIGSHDDFDHLGNNIIYPADIQKQRACMTLYSRQMGIYGRITKNLELVSHLVSQ